LDRIDRGSSALAVDSQKALKARDLPTDGYAVPQCVDDVRLLGDASIGPKQGRQCVVFLEIVHDELAQIAPVQARESI
jgi:hypothetical protein